MKQRGRQLAVGLSGLVLWACASKAAPTASTAHKTTLGVTASPGSVTPLASAKPGTIASPAIPATASGIVLGIDGKPAAGVTVHAYLIANNGGGVVSNHGASLHVLDTATLETKSADDGSFTLTGAAGQTLNVEAVKDDTTKAIKQGVDAKATGLSLQLALTGTVSGHVSAPSQPTVSNFEGVQVFIPGTSYSAIADKTGAYSIANVPVGKFTVVATGTGLGRAEADAVSVTSKTTTTTDLALTLVMPTVKSIAPTLGAVGSVITITGDNFGASNAALLDVTIAGVAVGSPQRIDDHTIKVTVPPGVTASGPVTVKVSGAESSAPFTLLTQFAVPATYRDLPVGLAHKYHVAGVDAEGVVHPDPPGTWTVTDTISAVDATGTLKATHDGKVTLTFAIGTRTATADITFHKDACATLASGDGTGLAGLKDGFFPRYFQPEAIACGKDGTLYVADTSNNAIRLVGLDGQVTTLAGGTATAVNAPPTPYPYSDENSSAPTPSTRPSGNTDGVGAAAKFSQPSGLAVDDDGNVYVIDLANGVLRKIDPHGTVTTIGNNPQTRTFKPTGNIADADFGLVTPTGVACHGNTLAISDGGGGSAGDGAIYLVQPGGAFHAIATGEGALARHLLDATPKPPTPTPRPTPTPLDVTHISKPGAITLTANGTVYVAESQGNVTAFAPPTYLPHFVGQARYAGALACAGDVLIWINSGLSSLTQSGTEVDTTLPTSDMYPVPGSGPLAWDESAETEPPHANFSTPAGVAIGPSGEIYVVDSGTHSVMQVFPGASAGQ